MTVLNTTCFPGTKRVMYKDLRCGIFVCFRLLFG